MTPRRSIIPVFIPHLGCPCRCVFCNQNSITSVDDSKVACSENDKNSGNACHGDLTLSGIGITKGMPMPSEIGSIIEDGISKAGKGAELAFYGGSFTAIHPSLMRSYLEAAYPYVSGGLIGSIRISTRPDAIDNEILCRLRYYGVRTIELGAQSMDDRVLKLSKRGHTAADTERAAKLIRRMGFSLILQMMVGLPGETPGSPMTTAHRIVDLEPDGVRIYPTAVIRGTELEQMWKSGEYTPLSFDQAVEICADLVGFFDSKGISVLRVGLNPSEDLSGEIAAGIYHPAFGDYCKSRLVYRAARQLLSGVIGTGRIRDGGTALFGVERRHLSLFVGQHRQNINKLMEEFGLEGISVFDREALSVTNYKRRGGSTGKIYSFASSEGFDEILSGKEMIPAKKSTITAGSQVLVEFLGIY